jgi:monofunctional biosynthetic peptidoglycan transglycosylase
VKRATSRSAGHWIPLPSQRTAGDDTSAAPIPRCRACGYDRRMAEGEDRRRASPASRWLRFAAVALAAVIAVPVLFVPIYALVPPVSTPMLVRWASLRPVDRQWRPLDDLGRDLPRAVVASEDARFCDHRGIDWRELAAAMSAEGGPSRGASTIPMQTARNLFLWQGRTLVVIRKPLEMGLALWMDLVWSKRRMLEIYLNIAEWGPNGVFGAEAGARRAFARPAARLGPRQSALMAAALPNPVLRNPGRPTRALVAAASRIERRVRAAGFACIGGR